MTNCEFCGKAIIFAQVDGRKQALEMTTEIFRMDYPGPKNKFVAKRAKAGTFDLYIPHKFTCATRRANGE